MNTMIMMMMVVMMMGMVGEDSCFVSMNETNRDLVPSASGDDQCNSDDILQVPDADCCRH